jgi:hypothetical protein
MLKIVRNDKNSQILVITPLLKNEKVEHKISRDTENSIKRNDVPFIWVTYSGAGKHATNIQNLLDAYQNKYPIPPYIQVLDCDIILGRHFLDRMYEKIIKSKDDVGFVYSPFQYQGHVNISFPPMKYDIEKLVMGNYISSNSLYKYEAIKAVKGFVTQEIYHRLSDWAMFLKMYYYGYIGELCESTSFVAISTKDDISAGTSEEFLRTKNLIHEDFVRPILER